MRRPTPSSVGRSRERRSCRPPTGSWPAGENLDSVANDAFRRAIDLDPDFAPVVFHLAELAMVAGRLDEAGLLLGRYRALSADSAQRLQLDLMLRCIRSGPGTTDWPALVAIEPSGVQLLTAGGLLAAGGRQLGCAEEAYRAALLSPAADEDMSRRWDAALGLHHIYIARGEGRRARALADSLVETGLTAARGLRILDALLKVGPDSVGAAEIALLDDPQDSLNLRRNWWLGEWSAAHHDRARLGTITRRMRSAAEASEDPADRVPARVMSARLLLSQGDTTAALDSLRAIRPIAPLNVLIWGHWEPLATERLLLAKLLLARGRAKEALDVAQSFDGQRAVIDVAFLRQSLEVRREAAKRLGDRDAEAGFSRRLTALSPN
jgi:tetratricopeptide (TPR) repeat protein